MMEWVCRWKPFWIPVGDKFQKAHLKEWQPVGDGSIRDSGENSIMTAPCAADSTKHRRAENSDCAPIKLSNLLDTSSAPKSSRQAVGEPDALTWELCGTEGTSAFCGKVGGSIVSRKACVQFSSPKAAQSLSRTFGTSGYEEDVSLIRDSFTTWVKAHHNTTVERHVVDVRKALTEYHSTRNQFERFRMLELMSRFEFDFRRRGNYFLKDSNSWCVQSLLTHNVAIHVPLLWPVCAHRIPSRILL